jgi:hypothetical protein
MNQILFLFLILVLAIGLPLFFKMSNSLQMFEGFSNYTLDNAFGNFPKSQTTVLVQDTYPPIGKNQISDETSYDMWWHYPVFKVGSYDQITNNIRFPNNPDVGRCTPGSMCGALYHEKNIGSNYVEPLPPLNPACPGTRVGFFKTDNRVITSLPYKTNISNILY